MLFVNIFTEIRFMMTSVQKKIVFGNIKYTCKRMKYEMNLYFCLRTFTNIAWRSLTSLFSFTIERFQPNVVQVNYYIQLTHVTVMFWNLLWISSWTGRKYFENDKTAFIYSYNSNIFRRNHRSQQYCTMTTN